MSFRLILWYYSIGLCAIFVYGRTDTEMKSLFLHHGIECNMDHPLSADEMLILQKNKMPDSKEAKCLMACVFRKAKMLDNKGMYDWENAYAMAEKEYTDNPAKFDNSKKLIEMCKKVNDEAVTDGESGCERSHHLFDCLTENAPKMGFQI